MTTVICDHSEGCTRDAGCHKKCQHKDAHRKAKSFESFYCGLSQCPWESGTLSVRCVPKEGK